MIMLNRIHSVILRLELLCFRRNDGVPYCVSFLLDYGLLERKLIPSQEL